MDDIPLRSDGHSHERCSRLLSAWTLALDFALKSQLLGHKIESNRDVFDDLMGKVMVELNPRTIAQRAVAKREIITSDDEISMTTRFVT